MTNESESDSIVFMEAIQARFDIYDLYNPIYAGQDKALGHVLLKSFRVIW